MAGESGDKRNDVRYDVLECAMLWRPGGASPERVGSVLITNASIGGLQLRTKTAIEPGQDFLLQIGSEEGPLFLPCRIRYAEGNGHANGTSVLGCNFEPKNFRDREAIGKYVLMLRDRVCASA
jgi:hypothetical protein